MNQYLMLSGETIEYPDPPVDVAAFLARVRLAAADPGVSVSQMIELIYGLDNPLLDKTIIPGWAMVTRAVFDDPAYRIMADQIGVKQVQLGQLDPAKAAEQHTISVQDAAERLGITPSSVRAAIQVRKLSAVMRNGEWYIHPNAVASYKVSNRGRKKGRAREVVGVELEGAGLVRAVVGNEPGRSLSIRGAELVKKSKEANRITGHLVPGWTRALVKVVASGKDGVKDIRVYVLEPDGAGEGEIVSGGLSVRGAFRVTREVTTPRAVEEIWMTA